VLQCNAPGWLLLQEGSYSAALRTCSENKHNSNKTLDQKTAQKMVLSGKTDHRSFHTIIVPKRPPARKVFHMLSNSQIFCRFFAATRVRLKMMIFWRHTSLPEIRSQCHSFGLLLQDDAIERWFAWLVKNKEQGLTLKESFSA
jgi:hypothetical protein